MGNKIQKPYQKYEENVENVEWDVVSKNVISYTNDDVDVILENKIIKKTTYETVKEKIVLIIMSEKSFLCCGYCIDNREEEEYLF